MNLALQTEFPVLIGIPGSPDRMDLQLHVNTDGKFWKLVVASGRPSDRALLHVHIKSWYQSSNPE